MLRRRDIYAPNIQRWRLRCRRRQARLFWRSVNLLFVIGMNSCCLCVYRAHCEKVDGRLQATSGICVARNIFFFLRQRAHKHAWWLLWRLVLFFWMFFFKFFRLWLWFFLSQGVAVFSAIRLIELIESSLKPKQRFWAVLNWSNEAMRSHLRPQMMTGNMPFFHKGKSTGCQDHSRRNCH